MSNITVDLEWRASRSLAWAYDAVDLYFRASRVEAGRRLVSWPKDIEMVEEEIAPSEGVLREVRDPALRITERSAQELVDVLWREGIKPSEVQKQTHPQTITAMQHHIDSLEAEVARLEGVTSALFELLRLDGTLDRENFYDFLNRYLLSEKRQEP